MSATQTSVEERRAAAETALERELRRIVDSGEYGQWFRRMSLFHRYAPANSLWIMGQLADRPDATGVVASYRTWQQLGRQVRKGERGVMVWYPKPYWVDPATGDRVRPPKSEADQARLRRRVAFGVGYVFELSAADGEPLPELARPAPDSQCARIRKPLRPPVSQQSVSHPRACVRTAPSQTPQGPIAAATSVL